MQPVRSWLKWHAGSPQTDISYHLIQLGKIKNYLTCRKKNKTDVIFRPFVNPDSVTTALVQH